MVEMNRACLLVLVAFIAACGSTSENPKLFGGVGGAAGAAGLGAAGWAGEAGATACPQKMFLHDTYCIDEQPALLANGAQGPAVSFETAAGICEGRGLRLCTEIERESSCPGGQEPSNGVNSLFCLGPNATWEWSGATCTNGGHCDSPCCNAAPGVPAPGYACHYDACEMTAVAASYHCCKDL